MVRNRPVAEQKLRAGFQRRVDRQAERYAGQLRHAEQLAIRLERGKVAGVFSGQAGGGVRRGAYVEGLRFHAFAEGCALLDGPRADALSMAGVLKSPCASSHTTATSR
jgi:hypothetical protein